MDSEKPFAIHFVDSLANRLCTRLSVGLQRVSASSAPLRSVTSAVVTATAMWRLMPETFLPAS